MLLNVSKFMSPNQCINPCIHHLFLTVILKYHYLNRKIVEVKSKEKINFYNEDGITVLKENEKNLKLQIDTKTKNLSDVLKLIDPENIIDINISNTPLEEIISDMEYQLTLEV